MKPTLCLMIVIALACTARAQRYDTTDPNVRFTWVDVYVTSADAPLAAFQLEVVVKKGDVKLVGIAPGEHPAFKRPAYYDPAALTKSRIILANFTTRKDLPLGKTRVARINVRVAGEVAPECVAKLIVAANSEGKEIKASASLVQGEPNHEK